MRKSHLFAYFAILALVSVVGSPLLSACLSSLPVQGVETAPASPAQSGPQTAATSVEPAAPTLIGVRSPLPPTVVSIKPDRGEEQLLAAPVTITFDQPMDPASTSAAFEIKPAVQGEVKVVGSVLTFSPTEPLKRDAAYEVTVSADATSVAGLKLVAPVSIKFVTAGFLEVSGTQPADGGTGVAVSANITVAFNRPVVPLTGVAALVQPLVITPTVPGKGQWLNTSIFQFTPQDGLAASQDYTVTVPAGLEDTAGGLLSDDYIFSFRTADPTVLSWLPENAASVKVESPITVTFSMPMDRASTEAAYSLTPAEKTGEAVPGSFTWANDDTALGFKPAKMLSFGTRYVAAVASTARPANGQGSLRESANSKLTFTTVSLPKVVRTDPGNGNRRADPTGGLVFVFASPMRPASFVTGTVTILPKPTRVITYYNEWDNSLFVDFDKQPATPYTVTLSRAVEDLYGNTLGQDFLVSFTTRNYDPVLQLNVPGQAGTYNAYTKTQTIVTYRNVPRITFSIYQAPVEDFMQLTGRDYWEAWDHYKPAKENLIHEWAVDTDAQPNRAGYLRADLTDTEGEQLVPGMYFLQLTSPETVDGDRNASRKLLARTTLNVTLKSTQTEALAWVTDLKSGQPVKGAIVRFTDGPGGKIDLRAMTDGDGIAEVTFAPSRVPWEPLLALATLPAVGTTDGDGFGVTSSEWQNGISPWDFNVPGGATTEPYAAYVYTDRPIYRPGQTVYWKAFIRRDDDARYSLPAAGQPITVTINDEMGNTVLEQPMTLSPMGTADGQLALSPAAGLGYYYISVQLTKQNAYGVGFQVAEYRKPEYEVSAQTDKPEYIQGEQVSVTVQSSYFSGGPLKNAKVSWVLLSSDNYFNYLGKQGPDAVSGGSYSFSDWDATDSGLDRQPPGSGGPLSQGEGISDAEGRFTFTVPADITKFPQSQRFTFDISITDVNNQVVSTQASAIVHKGNIYVGLRPQSYVVLTGKPSLVDVLTVDPQSNPVAKTDVQLVVNQTEWYSVREQAEDGRFYWVARLKKTPVYTETLTTGLNGTAVLTWTPKQPGEYKVEARARDKAGHFIRSAAFVWVSGTEYVSWQQENNDRITLVADRDEYRVGDTAEVLVASPYQGPVKALLTMERDHILSQEVIEIEQNSQVLRIPIRAEHAPDIYVSLMLVKGMDETSPAPSFKMGLKQLKVSVADKQLQLILTPRKMSEVAGTSPQTGGASRFSAEPLQVGPREKVGWDVQTLDAAGKPVRAEVSLALIDKAVLSLANDQAGTLMDRFYSQRALGVQTASTLVANVDRVVAQLAEGGKGGGGGGAGPGGLTVRREFPDNAYWNAEVVTGADGKAQVEVTLPDNLTTWTMDGRAITGDTLVGQTKTDIIATKELLVRPVLPRFFIEGDQAEISAIAQNNTKEALDVTIDLKTTGLDVPARTAEIVSIAPQSTYKATWQVTVMPGSDLVSVLMSAVARNPDAVSAKSGSGQEASTGLNDAVEITLPVYRYTTPEVVGTSGQVGLNESRLEAIRLPADADPTRGELEVTLEPSLAAGMTGGLTYLEHYPYECVEQTMSRFLPNVVSYQAMQSLGLERPGMEALLAQEVGVGLQRIYGKQHVDGGWGWWQADQSNVAVSAYVVFGLAKARQAGFAVDETVLDRAISFLERNLRAPQDLSAWQLNQQVFVVYALAEAGQMEPNRAGALYEQREKLSLYSQAYLAMALALINDDAGASRIKTLLADITNRAVVSATSTHWEEGWTDYWNMNTDTRTTSIVVDAIAKLDPGHSLAPNAVRWLMSVRKADRWETTQENAWAIMALTDWMLATGELEGDYDWQVLLNDEELGQGTVTPETVDQVIKLRAGIGEPSTGTGPALLLDQTNAMVIERSAASPQTGKGQLYYTTYLKTYLPVEELQPMNRGVVVGREYRLAECGQTDPKQPCPTITEARVGDVINVTLDIVVPHALHYVVVEDPLPAGTEAVDVSLATTSITAQGPGIEQKPTTAAGAPQMESPWWWMPTHTDLRDEKVALFATTLEPGSYRFSYQIRASLPGRFLTLPPTAYEMYFPEVWGRGAGGVFTVTD
jgi:uncharacterized protein YfaS (alpha-2-macroglobulin family)